MRTHSIDSVDFNVLLHLYGHRNEQPCAAGDVATAVRARPQLVYASLNRLSKQELVQHEATGEPRGYSLTEKGMSHLLKVSANEQWKTGGLISGKAAVYRLEPRPLKRGRVRVFSAKVHSTTDNRGPLHGKATVIIKTLDPDTHRGPFLHLFAQEVAGQLQLTNDVVEAELPSLHRLREIDSAAATLDSGSKSLLIRTPEGFISAAQHFIVQEYLNAQSLEDYLTERYVGPGQRRFSGIDSTGEWFELASQLAEHLKAVHDAGDFHRAISPSTIFVVTDSSGKPRFVCVDLGEAAFGALPPLPLERDSEDATDDDSESDRDASAAHNLDAIDYVAPEQRGRIFPSRAADLFSVGAVLYFALTGQAPAFAGIANHETLKSLIQQDLLRRSRSLFVRNTGIADIVSRCLPAHAARDPRTKCLRTDARYSSVFATSPRRDR